MSILPCHRPFLRFAFEGRAYQYRSCPSGCPYRPVSSRSSGGSPCSLERTGRAHSQLPRRLAHTGSVSGSVMRTQGLVLSHLSQLGLRVNWERANSCRCRGSLFSVWSLDSVNQTARLTQERAQSVLNCLNTFKNRTAAPLKQVSEAPGAYGGCSGGHTAGAAPYETASTLAPWPSPEVGVAERHAAGPSHSSLPPNLHPVVRPFIPSGRSAPGTGLQARCGLHGCLRQGLGGHVQRACSVGGLDGSPTALAYQLPRVAGSTPGLEPSQETLTRRARTGPYGQHCDRCVHQPTRWSTLPSHVATHPPPPPLESEASEVASRHSYSGLAQTDSRRAVTSCAPRRMETQSPDGPADLRRFGLAQVDLFASLETSHCQLFYSLTEGTLGTDALAHCARSGRKRSRSCSWHHTGLPGLGSQS